MLEDGKVNTPAQQLKILTKKYKLFYPEEILFDGETVEWVLHFKLVLYILFFHENIYICLQVHKLSVKELFVFKKSWIILLIVVCFVLLLILEPILVRMFS